MAHAPPSDQLEPLPTLEGRALSLGLALDADQILATTHRHASATAARLHLFAGLDAGLAASLAPGDVLVAEEIIGTSEAAEQALAALAAAGIVGLIARRYEPGILLAAHAHGIPPLVVDTPSFLHTGDRVRLDLDAAKIVNLSSGDRVAIRNLGDDERTMLRATLARCLPR